MSGTLVALVVSARRHSRVAVRVFSAVLGARDPTGRHAMTIWLGDSVPARRRD